MVRAERFPDVPGRRRAFLHAPDVPPAQHGAAADAGKRPLVDLVAVDRSDVQNLRLRRPRPAFGNAGVECGRFMDFAFCHVAALVGCGFNSSKARSESQVERLNAAFQPFNFPPA